MDCSIFDTGCLEASYCSLRIMIYSSLYCMQIQTIMDFKTTHSINHGALHCMNPFTESPQFIPISAGLGLQSPLEALSK